jgi:hypothetical protein
MSGQALNLPLDITWQRLGYSRDMIDTSFGDLLLPPKWRSSMAVYSYVVPEEQTAESYPNSRIVYLKLSCSITGFNISEDLIDPEEVSGSGDELDDLQNSTWEAILSEGWANRYWPCYGAISQIAIYPSAEDDVGPDDFPFIQDFEPKKRELYETRSESGEFLSGTSAKVNVQKGTTTNDLTEESNIITGGSASFGLFEVFKASASASGEWGTRKNTGTVTVDNTTTDSSREKRESTSFSTSFSQMYQLFNGYHLGTNRAVFVIAPRPHTVSEPAQVEFNLINGERKLEGIQEMFLIVRVPKKLQGICVQANLDTGHIVMRHSGIILKLVDSPSPGGGSTPLPPDDDDAFPPIVHDPQPGLTATTHTSSRLVVTRRVIRNCGKFSEAGQLDPISPVEPQGAEANLVVHEESVPIGQPEIRLSALAKTPYEAKCFIAAQRNGFQRRLSNSMLSGFSSGRYKARPITETKVFSDLTRITLARSNTKIDSRELTQVLLVGDQKFLKVLGMDTVGDVFHPEFRTNPNIDFSKLEAIRKKIEAHVLKPSQRSPG